MKSDGGLAGRQPLDLDVAPADAADAEAEHLADRLLGRPAARERLGPIAHVAALRLGQHPAAESVAEALERLADAPDPDDVDPELRGLGNPRTDRLRRNLGPMRSRSARSVLGE